MTVVELVKVIDNPRLAEPFMQIVNVVPESVYNGKSGGYWQGTISELLNKYYNHNLLQGLGNAKVIKLTMKYDDDLGEEIPEIIATDF